MDEQQKRETYLEQARRLQEIIDLGWLRNSESGKALEGHPASTESQASQASQTSQASDAFEVSGHHVENGDLNSNPDDNSDDISDSHSPDSRGNPSGSGGTQSDSPTDPNIPNGIYSPSGLDVLKILLQIRSRKNPKYFLGNIDSSVALVICDTEMNTNLVTTPIIYCTESFEVMTGYIQEEIIGNNCRFLQKPFPAEPGKFTDDQMGEIIFAEAMNLVPLEEMRSRLEVGEETQVLLQNFRKDGSRFENVVTIIPTLWREPETDVIKKYMVGFQADRRGCV